MIHFQVITLIGKMPIESIIKRLTYVVKNLPRHTNINSPFGSATQKKYLNFIVKII
jgi:hypothetical protein